MNQEPTYKVAYIASPEDEYTSEYIESLRQKITELEAENKRLLTFFDSRANPDPSTTTSEIKNKASKAIK